ncbi:MAG TPA: LysM domain-containing protein [Firmicutes bacterium]|nr:LysM domain-containing protein [Bacillota bacterium]
MKPVIAVIVFCVLLSSLAVGAVPPPYPGPRGTEMAGENIYVVVKGDTLWDICQAKLQNPWLWVQVWEQNPHITDPNWIYPGDRISLALDAPVPGTYVKPENKDLYAEEDSAIKEFVFKQKTQEAGTQEKPTKSSIVNVDPLEGKDMEDKLLGGFILEESMKPFGAIVELEKKKDFGVYGEEVYINKGKKDDVMPGDVFIIYTVEEKVSHPVTYKSLGSMVKPRGVMEAREVYDDLTKGVITSQRDAIRKGYYVGYEYPRIVLNQKNIKPDYNGYIVYFMNGTTMAAKGNVVYIDRGLKQGVKAGMHFAVMGEPRKVKDPQGGISQLPAAMKGRIRVLNARENVSTCLVVSSMGDEVIKLGDRIEIL